MKNQIVAELEELLKNQSLEEIGSKAKELRTQYLSAVASEQKAQKEKFLEEGGAPEDFHPSRDETDVKFDQLWADFSKKKLEWKNQIAASENENLNRKQAIISSIQDLTQNEENIKAAFEKMKAFEEEWKSIGAVPSEKYRDLQTEFSRVRDEFFYNIRIYKELLEHDLKRNLQLKEEVVEKIEGLEQVKSIKDLESQLKAYSTEWDEIGPTFKEEWEQIKTRYKLALKKNYDRLKDHYKQQKELQLSNLEKKENLVKRLESIVSLEISKEKKWRKFTDEVKEIQKEWKKIGFVPKERNDDIWKRFKEQGDKFFENKRNFYGELKQEYDNNKELKKAIIAKVDEIKDSDDWKEIAKTIKQLQQDWQEIGSTTQRDEQRLWRQFRAACNHFFERRKNQHSAQEKEQAENLIKKQEIITALEGFELTGDKAKDTESLEKLAMEFSTIGFVPRNKKAEVNDQFHSILDAKYNELGLSKNKQTELKFQHKVEEIKSSNDPDRVIDNEERKLSDEIRKIESMINQYENNLGFFGHSKGAEKLKMEVEKKLEKSREHLESLKAKQKMLRNL